jgi:hypothetical protein
MFGYRGGESAETVERKQGYMRDAQERWGELTVFDLSTIRNEAQLCELIKERLGLPMTQVSADVRSWAQGKDF